jgi:phospholipid transport system substrate-binding protein
VKKQLQLTIAALVVALFFAHTVSALGTPSEAVKNAIDGVLATLSDASLDENGKREAALAKIEEAFNFPGMSQRILATNWKKADQQQRERFVRLFTRILSNTYWQRIKAYSNETVEVVGEKIKNEKSARVKTLIKTASKAIPVDYSLHRHDGRWLAYDLVIEGVSLVRNYRSSYQQIAKQDGIDGLLDRMQTKIDETI